MKTRHQHTVDLSLKPTQGSTVELLVRRTVREAISYSDVGKVLEDATLHSQLVQIASLAVSLVDMSCSPDGVKHTCPARR